MSDFDTLPSGWTIWYEEPDGRCVLTFRPDIFNAREFPAACLPTIYVSDKPFDRRRPQRSRNVRPDSWHLGLFLEPDVFASKQIFSCRDDAISGAIELAHAFVNGEIDYRSAYQVPRDDYLDRLDGLADR